MHNKIEMYKKKFKKGNKTTYIPQKKSDTVVINAVIESSFRKVKCSKKFIIIAQTVVNIFFSLK